MPDVPPAPSPGLPLAGTFTQYTLGDNMGPLGGGITVGSDGALWLTAQSYQPQNDLNAIWRVTTSGVATMEYSVDPFQIELYGQVTTGSDGAVWFIGVRGGIGRITTAGVVQYFPLGARSSTLSLTKGPDGAVWFIDDGTSSLARITTDGTISEYPTPLLTNIVTGGIVTGSDGALWFSTAASYPSAHNVIGRYAAATGFRSFPLSAGSQANAIAAGPDGALWFTENGTNRIGRITTAGAYTEYPLPRGFVEPTSITRGPDNALWFTASPSAIGKITTSGSVSLTPVPLADAPMGDMTSTPDGSLWFGSQTGVVRFAPGNIALPSPLSRR